ncbi:uncharacterized protein BHQ10_005790 [Talaromyces amestolkiae]|uniref:Laccase n=1 Tax=Talaromyces amestolkiae TaxID=1196081 RepID=A0A364L1U4_TALAM|nr:uncharacterized protein BHQ10_005790 [Talaromyces amestolkiae]RAO69778.1 hypothetical protein BHQ10_005790 [Talaromyces amestolkiae]
MLFFKLLSSMFLASLTASTPFNPVSSLHKRCTNSADDRSCWGDYDISTNYYDESPDTGVVREYWWEIVNTTAAPDGIERIILSVNGSVPGPTIIADWGDTVVVHVTNKLENNGTGIHFHGIRQNYTNQNDGVPSITQCPIAPGESYTYTWKATQYGSSWYHSHYYVQAWDGVAGGILINGPATGDFDEDLGVLFLSDWMHETADQEVISAELNGPPTLNGGLINGTNQYNDTTTGTVTGSRFETTFVADTRYRIRLVSGAADSHFRFSIDNHTLEVISADFVPIVPYATEYVDISMGQRYDVIVTANATTDNYWMRATIVQACSENDSPDNVLGIVRYDSTSTVDPTSTAWSGALAADATCADEDMSNLVPYVALDAAEDPTNTTDFTVALYQSGGIGLWDMGATSFVNQWDYPSLMQIDQGNNTWGTSQNVYAYPEANEWAYMVIQTSNQQPHPMHMHGHDFFVLGQGDGTFDATTADLSYTNPPRRDVVMLPADGYVVIAFYTDNPGVWLMHCHIAWHTTEGLAIQILERGSEISALLDSSTLNSTCTSWDSYASDDDMEQTDSGI